MKKYDIQLTFGISIEAAHNTEHGRSVTFFTPANVKEKKIFPNWIRDLDEESTSESISATINGQLVTLSLFRVLNKSQIKVKRIVCVSEPQSSNSSVGFAVSVVVSDMQNLTEEEAKVTAESIAEDNIRLSLSPVNKQDWKYTCDYKLLVTEITDIAG